MYTFGFEKLEVWKKSRFLTDELYRITEKFPDEEKFGITNQLRRAIISVCSNIAEGSSRRSGKDQCHFYNLAYSSLMETLNQLIISKDLGYLNEKALENLRGEIHIVSLMINNLSSYTRKKQAGQSC